MDWKRAFTEPNENSMDFESGKCYKVFMSFYLDADTPTSKNQKKKVYANVKSNKPTFVDICLQKLNIPEDVPEESNYTVKTGAIQNVISWGTLASIAATTYAMF